MCYLGWWLEAVQKQLEMVLMEYTTWSDPLLLSQLVEMYSRWVFLEGPMDLDWH